MQLEVPVKFEGTVTVIVPDWALDELQCRILARNIALSRVLATVENEDPPDLEAFEDTETELEDFEDPPALEALEETWDNTNVVDICGTWAIDDMRDILT